MERATSSRNNSTSDALASAGDPTSNQHNQLALETLEGPAGASLPRSNPVARSIHNWRVWHCPRCYVSRYVALDLWAKPECRSYLCAVEGR